MTGSSSKIAFVTRRERPELTEDDALAVGPCADRGMTVVAAPWDDDDVDWHAFDGVVLRSCWDYHRWPARFSAWLSTLEHARRRVINPPRICRWNMRKTYLLFLERQGVLVPPTVVVRRGGSMDARRVAASFGCEELVVKPVIGAAGWRLFRMRPGDCDDESRLARLLRQRSVLIQPWLPEVEIAGEFSLVYFEGEYHHAARKRAAEGDFRVHIEYGGTVEVAHPPDSVRATADAAVRALHCPLPYARVDVLQTSLGALVMELELIEPELFLRCDPAAPGRFADVIAKSMLSAR